MTNIYDLPASDPVRFKQLSVRDSLFVNYFFPGTNENLRIFSNHNLFVYVFYGECALIWQGKRYQVEAGKCLFMKMGDFRQMIFESKDLCMLTFSIPDSYLQNFIKEYRKKLPSRCTGKADLPLQGKEINIHVNETTGAYFLGMLPYFFQQVAPVEDLIELKIRELIFDILADPQNIDLQSYLCTISNCEKPSLTEIMESNYLSHLSLAEFSKIANRSIASFKREFTSLYHTSPGKWLTQKRLEYAQLLLQTTRKSISVIADESGFENNSHFSRLFKSAFGSSPLHYQKMYNSLVSEIQ